MTEKNDKNLIKETADNPLYTYGDYLTWSDGQRYELIAGKVYLMTPAPTRIHQKVSGELFRQTANYLLDKDCEAYDAPFDVRLPAGEEKDEDIMTVVQPDILVVCDEEKLDEKGCRGAPDLIIEIISSSSGERDRKIKKDLYEKNGVKEYWLIDYKEKTVEIYLLTEGNEYGRPAVYLKKDKIPVGILSGLEINLSYVFRE